MRRALRLAFVLAAFAVPAQLSAQQVIDFEGLTGCTGTYVGIPAGYAGFSWNSSSWVIPKKHLPGTGYDIGTNGCTAAWNFSAQNPFAFSNANPFELNSFIMTSAWSPQNVNVRGFLGGVQLYNQSVAITNTAQLYVTLNWAGVDRVEFWGSGSQYVIDDIAVNMNAVPEPGTMILMGTGLAGLARAVRRRRKVKSA